MSSVRLFMLNLAGGTCAPKTRSELKTEGLIQFTSSLIHHTYNTAAMSNTVFHFLDRLRLEDDDKSQSTMGVT